jgi:D-amino peptidase
MKFIIVADIEGVTGVTTYEQAEKSDYAKAMLMRDLQGIIRGIKSAGAHEIILYDMHTDGRNINLAELSGDISVIVGKPINPKVYKSAGTGIDGLFLAGLHAMASAKTLLAHSYLREYERIILNGEETGEIGVEAALAAEQGIPLLFVSGDSAGCREAKALCSNAVCVEVKKSLGEFRALCYPPSKTEELLFMGAREAVLSAMKEKPMTAARVPAAKLYKVNIDIGPSAYLDKLKAAYPALFTSGRTVSLEGASFLECWSEYLFKEREVSAS